MPNQVHIHVSLLLTMAVWGLNLTAVKLLTQVLSPSLVALLRMLVATALLGLVFYWRRSCARAWSVTEALLGVGIAFLMIYMQQLLFAWGMVRTSPTNAALVMSLGPLVSMIIESVSFGKAMRGRQVLGLALALVGVAAVILHRPHAQWTSAAVGDALILLSVLTFASGGALMQRLSRTRSMLEISTVTHAIGTALLLATTLAFDVGAVQVVPTLPAWAWACIAFSGLIATAAGSLVWAKGIAVLGVGRTATYLSWVPVFAALFAALFLGEPFTFWHVLGMTAVMLGSGLAMRAGQARVHVRRSRT